ncbi:MAG: response regulator transcription factor [Phycisphaerae bacterium]|nr:response regulator transcription factor [Phycisphaerae bacterium]
MSGLTVLIVDDHAMVRKGLRMLLEATPDIQVVGEAGTVQEAIELAARLAPKVITLDLSMPGQSGVASVQRLRAAAPSARIVVVTMHDDPAYVRSAIAMGAAGYVNKSAADTELIAAIRAVARGRVFIDVGDAATLESILAPNESRAGRTPVDSLSEREREVLQQVARGYTNQQIADELGLSVKTVESYRARLMKKLGLKERSDLVRLAIDLGLITDA